MTVIAVTGGTGFVGGHLMRQVIDGGHTVRALTRRDQPACDGIDWVAGSLGDQESLHRLAHGADAAVHIAGAINARDRNGFAAANIGGTAHMLTATQAAGIRRFLHISSLTAREPEISDYGWSKAESEHLVRDSGFDWTIIRPPAVYGPGDTETLELFAMAKRGLVILPPRGRTSLIHVNDLCRLIFACLKSDTAIGALYEPDDNTPNGLSHTAFGRALSQAVGRRVRLMSIPAPIVRFAARMDRLVRGGNARLTPDRARYFCHPDWVAEPRFAPPPKLWTPHIPFNTGLAATAHWYLEQEWLK